MDDIYDFNKWKSIAKQAQEIYVEIEPTLTNVIATLTPA